MRDVIGKCEARGVLTRVPLRYGHNNVLAMACNALEERLKVQRRPGDATPAAHRTMPRAQLTPHVCSGRC